MLILPLAALTLAHMQSVPRDAAVQALADRIEAREKDWRNGSIVYQIFVDRFAPSAEFETKRKFYPYPRTLMFWDQTPKAGHELRDMGVWTHELEFWGGDIKSLRSKLDYVQQLGVDVVYLNPIFDSLTNHKYDAKDYMKIAPEYGTREDLKALADDLHGRNMKLVLDGVFNHMGKTSPMFIDAQKHPQSPYRDFFFFDKKYPAGYRAWANVANLPELNLENQAVRDYLWAKPDSVVQSYLNDGVDGWRLDVAFEIGYDLLGDLTQNAHAAKAGSLVIGEVWNYPETWMPAMDAIKNFHVRSIALGLLHGDITPSLANMQIARMVEDVGIEPLLKSWVVLDNHDTDRLHNQFPKEDERRLAQLIQFTVPGSPCIYYGTELGMEGGGDPEQRAPMRWDLVKDTNTDYAFTKKLLKLRKENRALRVGEFRRLDSEKMIAFSRFTEKAGESIIVAINPTRQAVKETISCRDGRAMNWSNYKDLEDGKAFQLVAGLLTIEVPPMSGRVLKLDTTPVTGFSPYKRIL